MIKLTVSISVNTEKGEIDIKRENLKSTTANDAEIELANIYEDAITKLTRKLEKAVKKNGND